ncbi:MAG: N-6 DNA methylase, partial [Elusimicrobia bacterium]|nr:N-6 DNA methylase [Elusimicrobiota bacterium]
STDNSIHYNFADINADVLGSIYEQYLGHILKKSQHTAKLKETHQHRKEQGIYYTPQYIVDYIVKNTVGEVLKETKAKDLSKLKILDPACGSGSFLIKAFDEIVDYCSKQIQSEFGHVYKTEILKNNIYGVDLDRQAVEITQMNLLLKTLYQKQKLPALKNIRCGNSLIDDKVFAKDKAFKWKEEFKEIMSFGGFDVVIGNPPYVVLESDYPALSYFKQNYLVAHGGKVNLYKLFIERSLQLLKDGGYLGFICPSNYLSSKDSEALRKLLLENRLVEIIEYVESDRVFIGVTQALTTIVVKKQKPRQNSILNLQTKKFGLQNILQSDFGKNENISFIPWNKAIDKMKSSEKKFSNVVEGYQGEVNVSTQKQHFVLNKQAGYLPLYRGNQISRYSIVETPKEWYPISSDKRGHYSMARIVFQEVSNQQQDRRIKATLIKENNFCGHTTNYGFAKKGENILCLLAVLNSKPVNYYFKYFNNTNHVPIGEIKEIPFPEVDEKAQQEMAKYSQQMLDLYEDLQKVTEHTDKYSKIKAELEKSELKIDELVYKLYSLTEEEIKIVENSGKEE